VTVESRYVVACNGRRVPLFPTGKPGEAVAGVRYRARRLSAASHPTIPVHAPLVFDLIDSSQERLIGRCIYHAEAPDGRPYTSRPANAAEAEKRRSERFQSRGHDELTRMAVPLEEINPIFPMTLDLRLPPLGERARFPKNEV
jgi:uncharacterized protein (DUF2126 family)